LEEDARERLLRCIDRVLEDLGGRFKHVIYFHLNEEFGIRREDIPEQLDEFSRALINLFGAGGRILLAKIAVEVELEAELNPDPVKSELKDAAHKLKGWGILA
jgi:hypothetical protein